jgi:hypothetical protein
MLSNRETLSRGLAICAFILLHLLYHIPNAHMRRGGGERVIMWFDVSSVALRNVYQPNRNNMILDKCIFAHGHIVSTVI